MSVTRLGENNGLFGRDDLLQALVDSVRSAEAGDTMLAYVQAKRGIGLTAVLRAIASGRSPATSLTWVGSTTPSTLLDALRHLAHAVNESSDAALAHALLNRCEYAAAMVVIDNTACLADRDFEFLRTLRFVVDDRRPHRRGALAVIAGGELPAAHDLDGWRRSQLEPLGGEAVFEIARRRVPTRIAPSLSAELRVASGGSPRRVVELLDNAVALDGFVRDDAGTLTGLRPMVVSSGPLLDRRLDKLSEPARQLIAFASCMGSDTPRALLETVHRHRGATEFDDLIDELVVSGLADDDGDVVRLSSELAERVVSSWSTAERQRLHGSIAVSIWPTCALTASGRERAFRHVSDASRRIDAATRLAVADARARDAQAQNDWASVQRALRVACEASPAPDGRRLALLVRSIDANYRFNAIDAACTLADEAFVLAGQLGDRATQNSVALRSLSIRLGAAKPVPEALAAYESSDPEYLAWRVALEADTCFARGDFVNGQRHARLAEDLARDTGDVELINYATHARGLQAMLRLDLVEATEAYRSAQSNAPRSSQPIARVWAQSRAALVAWLGGHVGTAADSARSASAESDAAGWWGEGSLAYAVRAAGLQSVGDIDGALTAARRSDALAHRSSYRFAAPIAAPLEVALEAYRGESVAVRAALAAWSEHGRVPSVVHRLADAVLTWPSAPTEGVALNVPRPDLFRSGAAVCAVELADWQNDPAAAAVHIASLEGLDSVGVVHVPGWPVSIPRALAVALAGSGRHGEAVDRTLAGLDDALAVGAQFDAALHRFDLARWTKGPSAAEAIRHAIEFFAVNGFTVWLLRAQQEIDQRFDGIAGAERALVYTDLVGSTPLNLRSGDRQFVALIREHQEIVDACVSTYRGTRFHNSGDGFGLSFATAADAVACAFEIHRRLDDASRRHPEYPLTARIGIALGRPLAFDGDLYGVDVVRAARICQLAGAGDVLASHEVLAPLDASFVTAEFLESRVLKGFDAAHTMYRLAPRP